MPFGFVGDLIGGIFGGGGDSGDQAAQLRAEEAAREERLQSAIDRINIMFGVKPRVLPPSTAGAPILPGAPSVAERDAYRLRTANRNRVARERQYSAAGKDLMGFYRTEADRQKADAASAIAVDMARRGLTAGSAATEGYGNLEREFNNRVMELRSRADSAVSGMRTSDEDARLNLISRIRQGMDVGSAVSGANTALENSIRSASETAKSAPLEGLFGDIKDFYEQRRAWDAYRTAYDNVSSGVKTPGSGSVSTGTVR